MTFRLDFFVLFFLEKTTDEKKAPRTQQRKKKDARSFFFSENIVPVCLRRCLLPCGRVARASFFFFFSPTLTGTVTIEDHTSWSKHNTLGLTRNANSVFTKSWGTYVYVCTTLSRFLRPVYTLMIDVNRFLCFEIEWCRVWDRS